MGNFRVVAKREVGVEGGLGAGGVGFIGSHVVEGMLNAVGRVRVLDDFSTGNPANLVALADRIELIRGSVADPAAALSATAGCEVVFHLAALPPVVKRVEEPLLVHNVTAPGPLNVMVAARRQ